MKKLGLWKGLCFHADAYQIHGQSITADNIGSLMPVSPITRRSPRRGSSSLWFEQHMFNDRLAVSIGQLAADTEFILSIWRCLVPQRHLGLVLILASDMPSGGPAYPLATPGVRVAITPNDKASLMIGVYNGDPSPNCASDDPQVCNNDGLDFSLDAPPLLMVEGAYKYNQDKLAGTIKARRLESISAPSPTSASIPAARMIAVTGNPGRPLDNDWGLYGIIDQLIWRVPGSEDPKGVGVFARFMGAPDDRNLVDFYFDGGITFTGMIARRPTMDWRSALPIPASRTACTVTTSIWLSRSRATTRR